MKHEVVITGVGVVSAIGIGARDFWAAACAGEPGISTIRAFDPASFSCRVAAQVERLETSPHYRPEWAIHDRATQFALVAASEALTQARLTPGSLEGETAGTYVGTSIGGVTTHEDECRRFLSGRRVHPTAILRVMQNAPAAAISAHYRLSGPSLTVSTACASSSQAIGEAFLAIRSGHTELVIAGGTDAPLSEPLFAAWDSLRVMSRWPGPPAQACRPFSADRTGLVLGEGAAFIVLESAESARTRGVSPLGRLTGYAGTTTTSHLTTPDPVQQARVMRRALACADVHACDIGYVHAHGTGTQSNDAVETRALHDVFGERAAELQISTGKAQCGHTLGAAGALGTVTALFALRERVAPPTINLVNPDPACDLNYVPNQSQPLSRLGHAMVNAFAFGGTNAALVLDVAI